MYIISKVTIPSPVFLLTEYWILRMNPVMSPMRTLTVISIFSSCASVMLTVILATFRPKAFSGITKFANTS